MVTGHRVCLVLPYYPSSSKDLNPRFPRRVTWNNPRHFQSKNPRKHKSQAKYVTSSSSWEESEVFVQVTKSSKPKGIPLNRINQNLTYTLYFTGKYVCLTCPHITLRTLKPSSRFLIYLTLETILQCPLHSGGLIDVASQQELRPKGPSAMLPVSPPLKGALDKFEQDFQAANLPEDKFIKPPPSTSKWYK